MTIYELWQALLEGDTVGQLLFTALAFLLMGVGTLIYSKATGEK